MENRGRLQRGALRTQLHGAQGGLHDFHMRAAAAQVVVQLVAQLLLGGIGVAAQQGLHRHDHAVEAVAALGRLAVDEGLLRGAGALARAQAFQRGDLAAHGRPHGITQERAATPSISTVQAPHSPRPQPYLGPFSSRSLRSTCSSAVPGAAGTRMRVH